MREKSQELEDLIFDRIRTLEEHSEAEASRSFGGLRPLIRSLVEYGAVAIELGERQCPPVPAVALEHARKAAWTTASPRLLPDRYLASRTVFSQFVRREGRSVEGYVDEALSHIQESGDVIFEHLFRLVSEELEQELKRKQRSTATKKLERVKALLSGELMEVPDLDYRFEATHVGVIGSGKDVDPAIRQLARFLDGQLLLVTPSPYRVWAWIGCSRELGSAFLEHFAQMDFPFSARLSLGEPRSGLAGWRRTHRQANAAVASLTPERPIVRYAEIAVLAPLANDDLAPDFLKEKFLAPLMSNGKDRQGLCETLRAYFSMGRNRTSAAAVLGISRQTVSQRLQTVESRLGQPLDVCGDALWLALQLEMVDTP
ncbi:MAG: PucR family transcriptional regulator [Solirubrobacterales bacterium]